MLKRIGQSWQERRFQLIPYIIIGGILIILPFFLSPYLQSMMTQILIFGLFAMSLDLLWGYTGLISLGHAAFFGMGGYTTGILTLSYGVQNFWLTAVVAILVATIGAAVIGFISLRVRGIYFLMVTLALAQSLAAICEKWYSITGGQFGLDGIPWPNLGFAFTWSDLSWYFFVFAFFIVCAFLLYRIINSPFGRVLQGIREDEPRMRALGYNTWLHKYIVFIISGLFAGVAGVLFARWNMFIAPMHIGVIFSIQGLLFVLIGGAGTLFGPVIGTAVIMAIYYGASIAAPERWPLIMGVVFVIAVMFLRGGIYPRLTRLWERVRLKYSYGSAKG